jgi:UDP-N-acetyl-D-glucosamine dehydrogenase
MNISVIGQGYVGSAIAMEAHHVGHHVVGIEIDESKLKILSKQVYTVTDDYSEISNSEIIIIAVPTPLDTAREPDLTYLNSACASIKLYARRGALIINESTSFPGTVREIIAPLLGDSFYFASAPERVDPANEIWNIKNTPRLVGGLTKDASQKAINFYKTISDHVIEVSSPEVAEAAKLFENTFRQVNIALVNEFAQIAHALNIPTFETLIASATKPYGFMQFLPSVGVGGHCIPVDPSYLSYKGSHVGIKTSFINLANEVNLRMPTYIADRIEKEFGVQGKLIQISGIAYKPNVSDTRESPALTLLDILRKRGAKVSWHDPFVQIYQSENSTPIKEVDIGIICTAHDYVDYTLWKAGKTVVIDVSAKVDSGWKKFL